VGLLVGLVFQERDASTVILNSRLAPEELGLSKDILSYACGPTRIIDFEVKTRVSSVSALL